MFSALLETLEWLTKYGFLEIFFGLGVLGLVAKLVHKVVPSNCNFLDVHTAAGGPVTIPGAIGQLHLQHSFTIDLRNVGPMNIYVGKAYFRPKRRRWWTLWLGRRRTPLRVHPQAFRIVSKDAFALGFEAPGQQVQHVFTDFETLLRPVPGSTVRTWLPLTAAADQREIEKRNCGVLYVEYATREGQGIHVIRV